jgi:predicted phosphodiesterase
LCERALLFSESTNDNSIKLLLLSDLHGRSDWYGWASGQSCDAVAIAGDLLDGFAGEGLMPQMLALVEWCKNVPIGLALSSGNHDANDPGDGSWLGNELPVEITPAESEQIRRFLAAERWMDALERPGLVPDHRSAVLETGVGNLVVTTIPFDPTVEADWTHLWREGGRLRRENRVPWIVLHHEPPADTVVGGMMGDGSLFDRIREYRPDFVLSGHLHDQPYRGAFADRVGSTWCFNPGTPPLARLRSSKQPNSILIDLTDRIATWTATHQRPRRPISETISLDGLEVEQ